MYDTSRFAILLLALLATLGASCTQPSDSPTSTPTLAPIATAAFAQVPTPTSTLNPTASPEPVPTAASTLTPLPTQQQPPLATTTPIPLSTQQPPSLAVPTPIPSPTQQPPPPPDDDISYSRRTPFVPLDTPQFLTANEATYLPDDDLVLGLEWEGEARAYPIRMLTFHHIVNDEIAGRPFLVTY